MFRSPLAIIIPSLFATACMEQNLIGAGLDAPPPGDHYFAQALARAPHVSLDAGLTHTCGILDGFISCWGSSEEDANWGTISNAPQDGGWLTLEAGYWTTCALNVDGNIVCWGREVLDSPLTLDAMNRRGLSDFALGTSGGLGLRRDGSLDSWGSDVWGQVSDAPDGSFIDVEAGYGWACAIEDTGQLWCWGDDVIVDDAPYAQTFASLRRGSDTLCGITTEGDARCWGGSTGMSGQPAMAISPSGSLTCALDDDGAIECSGAFDEAATVQQPQNDGWEALACGHYHCCVQKGPEDVCWGVEALGALEGWRP